MANVQIKYTKLFINNQFVDSVTKNTYPDVDPSTGKKIADVAEASKQDVDLAVAAARKAFHRKSTWRTMDASERGRLLSKLADVMERDIKYLAQLESLDNGKTVADSEFDITCSISTIRYYAGWTDKIHGKTIPADGGVICMTRSQPVGVCGQLIPWNYPILMLTWKWGPALAAGCTLILKPADQTPLTALAMAALSKEVGFPDGVINVLPGTGSVTGVSISSHMDIDKVAFTGSTIVGRKIMEAAAKSNLKRISLELGGKSPLVIFDDVDVDEAVEIAYNAIFANHGQNCCAGSRTYVHENIYDKFVAKATAKASQRKVGNPFVAGTEQGPQIDERMMTRVLSFIESGKKEGAKLETGGARQGSEGYFVQPTVFSNVTDSMTIAKEEIFGPVQSILKFSTLDEVIDRANASQYGLAAGVLTKNVDVAMTFAKYVDAGSVWINCYDFVVPQAPFGGFKTSGKGRELGEESLKEYLEVKTVTIKVSE